MAVTLSRIIKFGWQGFLRNGWLSASTIIIMILAAVMFEGLILFNVAGQGAVGSIQEKIDISVYFKADVPEDTILNMKRSLENLSEVKNVEYVSREQALENFKQRHAGEETITQTLAELDVNPLLASLNIKAKDPHEYATIAGYLDNQNLTEMVEKVTYAQNQVVIDRLVGLIDTMRKGGITLTIFLAFVAVVVTFNTIRLAIFSASEQISIMRLVGANNSFIRGPYVVEGVIYGAISALVSFLVLIPLTSFLSPHLMSFIPELDLMGYFTSHAIVLFIYQLLFCVILGILSGIIATRRYLHI
ncbi:MAG: permease-like cell division protein FtsX [Candidatus Jorgensenbacteria bacterium]